MNFAVSSATQPVTQYEIDGLARLAAVGHELTLPPVSQIAPFVCVVDDDVSVRESLELLIRCEGWQAETFSSAHEFLERPRTLGPSCLVLDYSLPRPQRSRTAEARRDRMPRHADHLHHGPPRCAHDGAGNEGGGSRIPNETILRSSFVERYP